MSLSVQKSEKIKWNIKRCRRHFLMHSTNCFSCLCISDFWFTSTGLLYWHNCIQLHGNMELNLPVRPFVNEKCMKEKTKEVPKDQNKMHKMQNKTKTKTISCTQFFVFVLLILLLNSLSFSHLFQQILFNCFVTVFVTFSNPCELIFSCILRSNFIWTESERAITVQRSRCWQMIMKMEREKQRKNRK